MTHENEGRNTASGRAKRDDGNRADFENIFQMQLLFREMGGRPDQQQFLEALRAVFGKVDPVANAQEEGKRMNSFAVHRFPVNYQNASVPAQVMITDYCAFNPAAIGEMQRAQFWNCKNGAELLDSCACCINICDFMAAGLDYQDRAVLLEGWLETALRLFPNCVAVWVPCSGKLLTREEIPDTDDGETSFAGRFVRNAVNIRFFRIQGSKDLVVDTLGLTAIGLPEVQYHFHGLDPNHVVFHARNVIQYLFDNRASIKDGETIDGLRDGEIAQDLQWPCRYEVALIPPERKVMDICPGKYASGRRHKGRNPNKW